MSDVRRYWFEKMKQAEKRVSVSRWVNTESYCNSSNVLQVEITHSGIIIAIDDDTLILQDTKGNDKLISLSHIEHASLDHRESQH